MTSHWPTVTIVGAGLIGGSAGMALADRRLADRIIGVGRSDASLATAQRLGAITEGTTDLASGVAAADLVLVATRVSMIPQLLEAIDAAVRPGTLLTDAGSTKHSIVAAWEHAAGSRRGRFVGSHPLAGSHQRGPQAATADLFTNRLTVLTPSPDTSRADVEAIGSFWTALGSELLELDPAEHDNLLAASSHAPHVIAAALAAATPKPSQRLTAGGWRDTTRISAGDPELWADILLDNKTAVVDQIKKVAVVTEHLQTAIETGDRANLIRLLTRAKEIRDALGS